MAQLTCNNLTLGYEGKKVIENISFSVNGGDYLCIVGENGSGKSTLMKAILHLNEPLCGTIVAGDGLKTTEIGYLPQQTVVQKDFPASVIEIVQSGCLNRCGLRPYYNHEEKKLALDSMERMGGNPSCKEVLSGIVRRTAAESVACQSTLRNTQITIAGRACFGS